MTSLPDLWAPRRHPYYLYCPDYRETSSGVVALHVLGHALNLVGHEAWVTAAVTSPRLRTPILGAAVEKAHADAGLVPITLYPEVVTGNPRRAPVVARFILNKPGLLGGASSYAPSEILFVFAPEFLPPGMEASPLMVPLFDLTLFRPGLPPAERRGRYFYAARYLERGGKLLPDTAGCVELSMRTPRTLAELGDLFRSAEILYSYERSALCTEAMICGCPVVYLPNPHLTEFPNEAQIGRDGAAWGSSPAEVARARATVDRVHGTIRDLQQGFWPDLERFVTLTQAAAQAHAAGARPRMVARVNRSAPGGEPLDAPGGPATSRQRG